MPSSDPKARRRARSLRLLTGLALRLRSGLGLCPRLGLRLLGCFAEAGSEVVEDEARRRLGAGRCRDEQLALADDEQAALSRRRLHVRELPSTCSSCFLEERLCVLSELLRAVLAQRRSNHSAVVRYQHGGFDLGRD